MNHLIWVACLLLASAGPALAQSVGGAAGQAHPSAADQCEKSAGMVRSIAITRDSGISEEQYIAKLHASGFDIEGNEPMRMLIHSIYGNGRTPDESAQDYLAKCKADAKG
jgi:hypothetical protein